MTDEADAAIMNFRWQVKTFGRGELRVWPHEVLVDEAREGEYRIKVRDMSRWFFQKRVEKVVRSREVGGRGGVAEEALRMIGLKERG